MRVEWFVSGLIHGFAIGFVIAVTFCIYLK